MERWEAGDHLMQQTPQAPPVHIGPVTYFLDDLGSQVFWGSAYGSGRLLVFQYLRESEVGEFDVAHSIDDDVFRLEAACMKSYSR